MTCHPEGVQMMTRVVIWKGADGMSSGRGADDMSSRRGVDDIFSMIEYIKSTKDDVWMTLVIVCEKGRYQRPLQIMCT